MSDTTTPTQADQLSHHSREAIDQILQLNPPFHTSATDDEIAIYLSNARDALTVLLPWNDNVQDQLETVAILRVLVRLHEIHRFHIESDDGENTLWSLLSRYRTCLDRVVASLACMLFSRLCAQQISDPSERQSDVRQWITETLSSIPPPPPSPSYITPSHNTSKRARASDSSDTLESPL